MMGDKTPTRKRTSTEDSEEQLTPKRRKISVDDAEILGLGLGVDGSVHSPWSKGTRKDFQARLVSKRPASSLQMKVKRSTATVKLSESTFSTHSHLKASIPSGKVVGLGVDWELHSDHTESKQIVGNRVEDCTVSFDETFSREDVDFPSESEGGFESKLCKFILEGMQIAGNSGETMEQLLATKNNRKEIAKLCSVFIADNKVTHYAHSLLLGANAYFVITMDKNNISAGGGGNSNFAGLLSAAGGLQVAHGKTKPEVEMQNLPAEAFTVEETDREGTKTIKRNPDKQAVLEVKLMPVSALIQIRILKEMVAKASQDYIAENSSIGGYCIK